MELLRLPELGRQLHGSLPLLVLHLVTPQPVLVEHREAGDSIVSTSAADDPSVFTITKNPPG